VDFSRTENPPSRKLGGFLEDGKSTQSKTGWISRDWKIHPVENWLAGWISRGVTFFFPDTPCRKRRDNVADTTFQDKRRRTTCSKLGDLQIFRRRRRANRIGGGAARVQSRLGPYPDEKIQPVWCRHNSLGPLSVITPSAQPLSSDAASSFSAARRSSAARSLKVSGGSEHGKKRWKNDSSDGVPGGGPRTGSRRAQRRGGRRARPRDTRRDHRGARARALNAQGDRGQPRGRAPRGAFLGR
jgi:hypothetical protein